MPTRRVSSEHQEAVSRRLAQLSADLAVTRDPAETSGVAAPEPAVGGEWWAAPPHPVDARPPLSLVPDEVHRRSEPADPGVIPVPGRHAARRRGPGWGALLPDSLRGRVGLGPGPLALLAVMVAIGLAATTWWVIRSSPQEPVSSPPPPAVGGNEQPLVVPGSGEAAGEDAPAVAPTGVEVTVDVTGRVRRPGIAVLDEGDRVVDAIEAAGGARRGVDLSSVNLARVLVDGEQIVVGVDGGVAPPAPAPAPAGASPTAPTALVDLNLATQAELEALPEVGPVTAAAILAWREQNGSFTAVEELLEVDGIGDATLAQLAPYVTV